MDRPNLEILIDCKINFKHQVYNQVWVVHCNDKFKITFCTETHISWVGDRSGEEIITHDFKIPGKCLKL